MITLTKYKAVLLSSVIVFTLTACNENGEFELREPEEQPDTSGRLFDSLINRGADGTLTGSGGAGLPINEYLWQASLDTVDVLPLETIDPFTGVIATDWGSANGSEQERFRMTVFVTSQELRVDALRVAVFRQVAQGSRWVDAPASPEFVREVEDVILLRARELRIADQN
ncbi:MAG: DUF3576 domain-containing protein [Pseudomonadota bacterium]